MDSVYSVSEITGEIKQLLEEEFYSLSVIGEISNFKDHISGHWYFSLKDSDAAINCTMWRGNNSRVFFTPQNGMKIIAKGRITVYPPRGNYQLDVISMQPAGEGELQAAFERLKKQLAKEGLFDEEFKKSIPQFPKKIGIITGGKSAAIQDMLTTAQRRYPLVEIVFIPTKVQGKGAAEEIVRNIKRLNDDKNIDVIIIGRGGGSLEDLWAFNEEIVARAVFNSRIPIISGVGHEIDFTIADFVADIRAATPTAAMELATPDKIEIYSYLKSFNNRVKNIILEGLIDRKSEVDSLIGSYGFRIPESKIKTKIQLLDHLNYKISNLINNKINNLNGKISLFSKIIESADVQKMLKKGYSIIKQNGKFISRSGSLDISKKFNIKFYDNEVEIK